MPPGVDGLLSGRRPPKPVREAHWTANLLLGVLVYVAVAFIVFRLRNPHLTETQVFLGFPTAMAWGTMEKK